MELSRAPALWPALCLVSGIAFAPRLLPPSVGLLVAVGALALAVRRRWSAGLAGYAAGWLIAVLAAPQALPGLDRERVVEIEGAIVEFGVAGDDGWRTALEPAVVVQGRGIWLNGPRIDLQLPPGVVPPALGARIRVRGHLRRAAGFANEHHSPPGAWRLRVKSARFLVVAGRPGRAARLATAIHRRALEPFTREAASRRGVALARSLLFGELSAVPDRDQRALRRAGLAHLLAVSGMNVALAVAFVAVPAGFLRRRARLALFSAAVVVHLVAVGGAPSLLRASAMAGLALAALALRRPPQSLQILALSAATLAVLDPVRVGDLGFQLSCVATLGLVALAPHLAARLPPWPRLVRLGVATALAAQIATAPLCAAQFAVLSPLGLALNLVYVPLASALLVGAFGWLALALVWAPLAASFSPLLDTVATPFWWLAKLPAGPWLSLPTEAGWGAGFAAGAATAWVAALLCRRRLALLGLLLPLAGVPAPCPSGEVELVLADVGQGDGLLLRTSRTVGLIDGGGIRGRDLAARVWLPLLARRGVAALDAMVVSHGDADHCGGLIDLAVHLPVRELWGPAPLADSACVRELRFWTGAPFRPLSAGDRRWLGEALFEVHWPPVDAPVAASNDASLAARVFAGGRTLLLTGDLDGAAEARLVASAGESLASELIKVGHHGSARGTGEALLATARPRIALLSVGLGNRFGHPAPAVIARLARHRVRVVRTDLQGGAQLSWSVGGPIRWHHPGSPRDDG